MGAGVLVVDDEVSILRTLERELRPWLELRQLEFWPARSAAEALDLLQSRSDDAVVVVSDMKMPAMGGDAFLEEVRLRWPHMESVILSGHAEPAGLSRAVGAGARGYLTKPWEPAALTRLLDEAVDRAAAARREQRARRQLQEQLDRTLATQRALFEYAVHELPQFDVALTYRPLGGTGCGGDFYEVLHLGEGLCGCLVGDVSGHGVDAAFVTGVVHMLIRRDDIRSHLAVRESPGAFLESLNEELYRSLSEATGVTVALSVLLLNSGQRRASYAYAGSPPAFRLRSGLAEAFPLPALPLGVVASAAYPSGTTELRGGDRWILVSDGAMDRGPEGLIPPGEVANDAEAAFWTDRDSRLTQEAFVRLLARHFAGGAFLDDVTILSAAWK